MKNDIFKNAALNAALTALYIAAVASFLFYAPNIFGKDEPDTVLAPILMLSLFVFSAAVTSMLVFGKPILWYLDGKKKEAIWLLFSTLGIFLVITILLLLVLYIRKSA